MSASIGYHTIQPVAAEQKMMILKSIEDLTLDYEWWAEPMIFYDHPDYPGHLCGDTKLFCLIDDEAGVAHDSFMLIVT